MRAKLQLLEVVTGHSQFLSHFSIPQAMPTQPVTCTAAHSIPKTVLKTAAGSTGLLGPVRGVLARLPLERLPHAAAMRGRLRWFEVWRWSMAAAGAQCQQCSTSGLAYLTDAA